MFYRNVDFFMCLNKYDSNKDLYDYVIRVLTVFGDS